MNEITNNNKGFSLIEMVVAVMITAIMMIGVATFMSASLTSYRTISVNSTLQEESQTANNFLGEILLEAVNIAYSDTGASDTYWLIKSMSNDEGSTKYAASAVNYDYYFFILSNNEGEDTSSLRYVKVDPADETLIGNLSCSNSNKINETGFKGTTNGSTNLYDKYIKNQITTESSSVEYKYNVVAKCVSDISIGKRTGNNLFDVKIVYEYINKSYTSQFSVNSRNKVQSTWN